MTKYEYKYVDFQYDKQLSDAENQAVRLKLLNELGQEGFTIVENTSFMDDEDETNHVLISSMLVMREI